jgi:hypothetical protein
MNHQRWIPGMLAALFVLAGCGTSTNSAPAADVPAPAHSSTSMAPGMSMAPGESMSDMGGSGSPATTAGGGQPSAQALLICGPEIRRNIGRLLDLSPAPHGTSTWVNHVYTCTYRLPVGPLVLEVKEAADDSAAHTAFASLRHELMPTQRLAGLDGLGLPAFETRHGTVVFLKDNMILRVDGTKLTVRPGKKYSSQTDLAYEVATDVMGCWAES